MAFLFLSFLCVTHILSKYCRFSWYRPSFYTKLSDNLFRLFCFALLCFALIITTTQQTHIHFIVCSKSVYTRFPLSISSLYLLCNMYVCKYNTSIVAKHFEGWIFIESKYVLLIFFYFFFIHQNKWELQTDNYIDRNFLNWFSFKPNKRRKKNKTNSVMKWNKWLETCNKLISWITDTRMYTYNFDRLFEIRFQAPSIHKQRKNKKQTQTSDMW